MQSGPEQLKEWMHRRQFLQREAAEHLGFDETYVSQILGRRRRPGLDNAIIIERRTGIPVEAWLSSQDDNGHLVTPAKAAAKPHYKA